MFPRFVSDYQRYGKPTICITLIALATHYLQTLTVGMPTPFDDLVETVVAVAETNRASHVQQEFIAYNTVGERRAS